jgi:hypothetical protein
MRHGGIAKRAHHMEQRVRVAVRDDVHERFRVAASGGHVREFDRGWHALLRVEQRRQPVEALVGDPRDADVRFGAALRSRRLPGAREQLKEGGLA